MKYTSADTLVGNGNLFPCFFLSRFSLFLSLSNMAKIALSPRYPLPKIDVRAISRNRADENQAIIVTITLCHLRLPSFAYSNISLGEIGDSTLRILVGRAELALTQSRTLDCNFVVFRRAMSHWGSQQWTVNHELILEPVSHGI